jgi:hypothetical protein
VLSIQGGSDDNNGKQQLDMPEVRSGERDGSLALWQLRRWEVTDDKKVSDSADNRSADSRVAAAESRAALANLVWPGLGLDPVPVLAGPVLGDGEPDSGAEPEAGQVDSVGQGAAEGVEAAGHDAPDSEGDLGERVNACNLGPIEAEVCRIFGDAGPAAVRVGACESGTNQAGQLDGVWATSGDSYGLFQIHYIHAARFPGFWEHWQEVEFNIMMAWTLYSEQGWRPWSCSWAAW